MNVFVLPSWYPSQRQPMAGLFVRDQARALARVRPGWNIVVGGWGHHDGALSLRSVGDSLRALAWRARARPGWQADAGASAGAGAGAGAGAAPGPLHELLTPRLSWTLALAQGGARGLLAATRHNLALAEARFGRIDLVHAHVGFPAGWIAAQLAAERGLPYVLTEHMSPFPFPALQDAQGAPVAALRLAFERAAATVAVSAPLATRIRACGLPCSDVIPNAVDDARFAADAVSDVVPDAVLDPARFVFFTLGALVPQKGVDVLLRALAQLPPQPRPVELHIGGDGPERLALQALAATLGVQDRVRWLGALRPDQTPAHFARCDAFVLASRHETFGVVLAEALMSGKPVVATRCGGPEDIVTPANGLLVAPQDPAALAVAMQAMVQSPARYAAATLRADAVARFGLRAVGERVAALSERVMAGCRPSDRTERA